MRTTDLARGDQIWSDLPMKRVKIAELKARLSAFLRAVERGETIEVTDRDRPIACLVPYRERGGGPVVRPSERPFSDLRGRRYPTVEWPASSLELLQEERGER
jgi:prevent-host-death family protein